ncbi:hypothetical protein QQ045_031635 [Rhodiola kirilowii]
MTNVLFLCLCLALASILCCTSHCAENIEQQSKDKIAQQLPDTPSSKPLVLWLNGGPGCSSIGYGEAEEISPFRIQPDEVSLYLNPHAWNQAANILFLDSPAGVGYSYSKTEADTLNVGDKRTAENSLTFLLAWLERFPQYKGREFYIAGESYAGIYAPQLTRTILRHNSATNDTSINLKGYMVGNALIDYMHDSVGTYQYLWSLGLISNQMYIQLNKTCAVDSTYLFKSPECKKNIHNSGKEIGKIDRYSIFTGTRTCQTSATKNHTIQRSLVAGDQCDAYDPCTDTYSTRYFNLPAVRKALHVRPESKQPWAGCRQEIRDNWKDNSISVLDIYHESIQAGIRIWVIR